MRQKKTLLLSAFMMAILSFSGLGHAQTLPSATTAENPAGSLTAAATTPTLIKGHVQTLEGKYLLSPGDSVNLSVYGAPEFDQPDLVIRPDGFLTIKPIGEMDVAGMDIEGLSSVVKDKLKYYLKEPQVSLSVSKFHPAIVYVLGAVQKPGAYEIHGNVDNPDNSSAVLSRGRLTVSNLIANAGGITQTANLHEVNIKNNETNEQRTVDLISLLKDGDIRQDVIVHSGDTIMVPQGSGQMDDDTFKLMTQSALAPGTLNVRVMGKVTNPGVYSLSAQSAGINSAIASARGFTIDANQRDVRVMRMSPNGQLTAMKADPYKADFVLRDNDVVVVDERNVPVIGRGFDYAARVGLPFLTLGSFANSVLDILKPDRRFPLGR